MSERMFELSGKLEGTATAEVIPGPGKSEDEKTEEQ